MPGCLSSAPGDIEGLERLLVGSVGHYCLSHAFCPVVWVPAPELDQDKDITDQPIGENASPAGEHREDAEQASRLLREELRDNGPARRPCHHRPRWSVLAGQLASGP